jgi:predicted ATP-dependent serine protease
MNLRELKKLKFKYLTFQGRWKDFIGLPSTHFHLAIHGLPGQGKSTFCILFAEYLAENFGAVMYVSGEQGLEKTLQDIINRTGANSDKIDFSDPKNYDEVYTCVERNKYNFIFIDSLNTLQIDEKRLKKLKEYYSQSAFITISQSTKDGKMKGNNEILHDADTVIGVHKGMAITSKNRFNASDRHFEVFPTK